MSNLQKNNLASILTLIVLTLTALTNSFKFQLIGHGHPTSTYGFRGTMDYFKIKNKL